MQGVLWVQVRAALAFELWINCSAAHEPCSPGPPGCKVHALPPMAKCTAGSLHGIRKATAISS